MSYKLASEPILQSVYCQSKCPLLKTEYLNYHTISLNIIRKKIKDNIGWTQIKDCVGSTWENVIIGNFRKANIYLTYIHVQ